MVIEKGRKSQKANMETKREKSRKKLYEREIIYPNYSVKSSWANNM